MKPLPHVFEVSATAAPEGDVELEAERLPFLHSAPPVEFGGPGDRWSPETFLTAAVGDCFVLTFRAVARAAKLPWASLRVDVAGTLDRVDRVIRFTGFDVRARLVVLAGTPVDQAEAALLKAEQNCLISNSLRATVRLHANVIVDQSSAQDAA